MTDSHERKVLGPIVVLSGGWGYGNLGDDAILVSALKLIRENLPEAAIRVITCDEHGTADLLHPDQKVTIPPFIGSCSAATRCFMLTQSLLLRSESGMVLDSVRMPATFAAP